jgi:hypothetical protein
MQLLSLQDPNLRKLKLGSLGDNSSNESDLKIPSQLLYDCRSITRAALPWEQVNTPSASLSWLVCLLLLLLLLQAWVLLSHL